jgi:hypothetical protein
MKLAPLPLGLGGPVGGGVGANKSQLLSDTTVMLTYYQV